MKKKDFAAFSLAFLMLGLCALTYLGYFGTNSENTVPASGSRLNLSYLGHAFFPREPRLNDVGPISGFSPIGIASYGPSGQLIHTNSVRGVATFKDLGIGFFSAEEINNSIAIPYVGANNASLQENSVLWLGNLGAYWTQNVVILKENSPISYTLQLIDNIWNFTSSASNMNQNDTIGTGTVQCFVTNGVKTCFYFTVDPQTITVSPPFTIKLTMSLDSISSAAATVLFQYQILDSSGKNYTGQYDSVKLFPDVAGQPYFQIGGNSPVSTSLLGMTTLTLPSDLEFTLGGPGGGSSVFLNSVNGSEKLFYSNGTSFIPAPNSYSIGSDTAEQASGVSVSSNLTDPSMPEAILKSGINSVQKLWPLPLSIVISGQNDFGNEDLQLTGNVYYSTNQSTLIVPAVNLSITESRTLKTAVTDLNGRFGISYVPSVAGEVRDSFSYSGSLGFEPANATVQIAVSLINVSSSGGNSILARFNSSSALIQNQSAILIPLLQGTEISVSFQNITTNHEERELFAGYSNTPSMPTNLGLSGNKSQSVYAVFVKQYLVTIENSYTNQDTVAWYNQSSTVSLSAPNSISLKSGQALIFHTWWLNGRPEESSSPNFSISVNSPLFLTAEYTTPPTSFTTLFEIGAVAIALIAGLVAGYFMARRVRSV